jgi:hypothetical protein
VNRLTTSQHQETAGALLQTGGMLQRKCDCGQHTSGGGECAECGKEKMSLQRATQTSGSETRNFGGVPAIVHDVLRFTGQPLDTATRTFFEPRFGHDFSRVRVHSDERAAESAHAVNALAYTSGSKVVFGKGQYDPTTHRGRQLLAHELTHVVQQGSGVHLMGGVGRVGDSYEHQADQVAARVVQGKSAASFLGQLREGPLLNTSPTAMQFQKGNPHSARNGALDPTSNPAAGALERARFLGEHAMDPLVLKPGTIDVLATHIKGKDLPVYHLFLVYNYSATDRSFFRGGPGGACPNVATGEHGTILMTAGEYDSTSIDWSPGAPSVTVTDTAGDRERLCLSKEAERIQQTCTPYEALGPNSNTVAKTLLSKCGLPLKKPVALAPGWGDPDL